MPRSRTPLTARRSRSAPRRRRAGQGAARIAWQHRARAALAAVIAVLLALGALGSGGDLQLILAAAAIAAAAIATQVWGTAQKWAIGAQGERTVARALRRLERRGWTIQHDLQRPRGGNIDHLAIGPHQAFTIETKSARYEKRGLAQARGQAAWAARHTRLPVTPVLCIARRRIRPYRHDGVLICSANTLARALTRGP